MKLFFFILGYVIIIIIIIYIIILYRPRTGFSEITQSSKEARPSNSDVVLLR